MLMLVAMEGGVMLLGFLLILLAPGGLRDPRHKLSRDTRDTGARVTIRDR